MKKGKNTKGVSVLKRIIAKAKQLRKASPRTKWTNLVKQAAKKVK